MYEFNKNNFYIREIWLVFIVHLYLQLCLYGEISVSLFCYINISRLYLKLVYYLLSYLSFTCFIDYAIRQISVKPIDLYCLFNLTNIYCIAPTIMADSINLLLTLINSQLSSWLRDLFGQVVLNKNNFLIPL